MAKPGPREVRLILRDARTIALVIEYIDDRAISADGPVTPTLREASAKELRTIYLACKRIKKRIGKAPRPRR